MRPPRALWVPFDLGRPFGAPNEPAFQARVLDAALALLERRDGPVILEDFPDDAPGQGSPDAMEGMVCPVPLPRPVRTEPTKLIERVLAEIDDLAPWHELFCQIQQRKPATASGLSAKEAALFLDATLRSGHPPIDPPDNWGKQLRFVAEDLRNYYLAAALSRPGGAAPARELADWFWGDTHAGSLILALHPVCSASEDQGLKLVAQNQLVPRAQRHRLQGPSA
jgi:hypothetical protein